MGISWGILIIAGLLEIGWPLGLKNGFGPNGIVVPWVIFAAISIVASGVLLFLALKNIPIGTAYAVWTGIGAVGTFFVGIIFFGDVANAIRIVSIALITAGIIGLKIA